MDALRYSYNPVPTLREFALSNAFIRGVLGPFGSGKSSACAVEIARRGREQKPGPDGIRRTRFAVIRNTIPQLLDTTIRTFFQWFPPEHFGRWHATTRSYEIVAFPECHIEVLFRALDEPDDIRKLLSLDLTGAWVNEGREVPWTIIEALQGRLGRYPAMVQGGPTWSGLWLDTNAPDTDSRWYRFFEEQGWRKSFDEMVRQGVLPFDAKPDDYARIFKQPSGLSTKAENLPNLQKGYYQRLAIDKTDEWVKVYVNGDYGFVSDNKGVFSKDFSEAAHVRAIDPIPGVRIYRSWDFGLTPACVLSQVLPDGRWLVFDEICADDMGIDNFSDEVLERCGRSFRGSVDYEDIGDPAGEQRAQTDERTCFEILQAKGIDIRAGMQTLTIRLESVRRALTKMRGGEAGFVLHPRCKRLRKGFMGAYYYRRLAMNTEKYSNKPEKNDASHPMDALEYAATELFGAGLTSGAYENDDYPSAPRSDAGRSSMTGY